MGYGMAILSMDLFLHGNGTGLIPMFWNGQYRGGHTYLLFHDMVWCYHLNCLLSTPSSYKHCASWFKKTWMLFLCPPDWTFSKINQIVFTMTCIPILWTSKPLHFSRYVKHIMTFLFLTIVFLAQNVWFDGHEHLTDCSINYVNTFVGSHGNGTKCSTMHESLKSFSKCTINDGDHIPPSLVDIITTQIQIFFII